MKNNKPRLLLFSLITILGFIGIYIMIIGSISKDIIINSNTFNDFLNSYRINGFYGVFNFMCIVGIIGLTAEAILSIFKKDK